MHPFRDKDLQCPRCGKPLARYPDRDKWRCRTCNGALVGGDQLVIEVGPHASPVIEGDADPARSAIHPCPACAFPMTPYTVRGTPPIELDRCVPDHLVWFDGGELGKVRAAIPNETDSPLIDGVAGYLALTRREELVPVEPLPIDPRTPMSAIEWQLRVLCADGACTGIVENGACKVCGATSSGSPRT